MDYRRRDEFNGIAYISDQVPERIRTALRLTTGQDETSPEKELNTNNQALDTGNTSANASISDTPSEGTIEHVTSEKEEREKGKALTARGLQGLDAAREFGQATIADGLLPQNIRNALALSAVAQASRLDSEDDRKAAERQRGADDAELMEGGQDAYSSNSRGALAARKRREKKDGVMMAGGYWEHDFALNNRDPDFYPWSRRTRGVRRVRGDVDGRRTRAADADGKRVRADDPDGRRTRTAIDEDGRRVVVDKDGRIATDAEGRRITIGDEDGFRVADAGDGTRVIVDADDRVLIRDGEAIRVNDDADMRITTEPDGSRVAVMDDGPDRIVIPDELPDVRVTTGDTITNVRAAAPDTPTTRPVVGDLPPVDVARDVPPRLTEIDAPRAPSAPDIDTRAPGVPDAPTVDVADVSVSEADTPSRVQADDSPARLQAPDIPETPDIPRATAAPDFRQVDGSNTRQFQSFLAERGESLADFQTRVRTTVTPDIPDVSAVDVPTRLNTGSVRTGRFIRMLTPNGLDIVLTGAVAGGIGTYVGLTQGNVQIDENGLGWNFNEMAAAKAAGETLPVAGTTIAFNDGRNAEGTVRAIEDVVEFASPFAFAAMGAGGGAAVGSAGAGIGAVPGAIIGGIGGLIVGVGVSLTASELTRAIARGIGYDDVDRGMIGAWLAPEYAEQMEALVRNVSEDGVAWGTDESLSDVMERINEGADSSQERIANLRNVLNIMNEGIYARQQEQIAAIADRVSADTGIDIDDVDAMMRLPEARAQILEFYREQAAANPNDAEIQNILQTIEDYEVTEAQRINAVVALSGTDAINAQEFNEEMLEVLGDNLLGRRTIRHANPTRDRGKRQVENELNEINFEERMRAVGSVLEASEDADVGQAIRQSFTNGTTVYDELGTSASLMEAYSLMVEAEEFMMQKQLDFVTENFDQLSAFASMDMPLDRGLFSRTTSLGASLNERLEDMDEDDPDATELRRLLQQTNNLQNLTPEQLNMLLNNAVFAEEFAVVLNTADADHVELLMYNNAFNDRREYIDAAQQARRDLQDQARTYGFAIGASIDTSQDFTLGADARALTTETEPEPAPSHQ